MMNFPRDRTQERRALSFLQRSPLVRRRGGWRFGAAKVSDPIVERLVASGKAFRDGDVLHSIESE